MCESKVTGIMPSFLIGRFQRREQPCNCHQPAAAQTPTQYAQKVLLTVGGIVILAGMNVILHVALIALVAVLGIAVLGSGWWLTRRVRSLRQQTFMPAPLEQAPWTTVTGVRVQAIDPAKSQTAIRQQRSKVRP
jgi:hypothetical protein